MGVVILTNFSQGRGYRLTSVIALVACVALPGCAKRAYNELYIDNMAAEIRDLEDQLYEYDYEYRRLEQEIDALRQENARLRSSDDYYDNSPKSYDPLEFAPQNSQASPVVPDPPLSEEAPSILENNGTGADQTPFPGGDGETDGTLPTPGSSGDEFDLENLAPPTIEPGEPMPPQLPVVTQAGESSESGNELQLELSRIEVPAMLASQRMSAGGSEQPQEPAVKDTRVTQLGFHPTLSRSANFDDRTDEDGLYLVLQPLNQASEMVSISADLSVVVLDPAQTGDAARIGRWDYRVHEVKAMMHPIGTAQGIHLRLPWQGAKPVADRVVVFARYTFPNGRQVVGEKTIFVSDDDGMNSVWVPRARTGFAQSSGTSVVPAGTAQTPTSNQVVRPAGGQTASDPAPMPFRR